VTYLFTKKLKYDAIAASVNEVSLVFRHHRACHRQHLGPCYMGSLVGLGRAHYVLFRLLVDVRRLPDATPGDR